MDLIEISSQKVFIIINYVDPTRSLDDDGKISTKNYDEQFKDFWYSITNHYNYIFTSNYPLLSS